MTAVQDRARWSSPGDVAASVIAQVIMATMTAAPTRGCPMSARRACGAERSCSRTQRGMQCIVGSHARARLLLRAQRGYAATSVESSRTPRLRRGATSCSRAQRGYAATSVESSRTPRLRRGAIVAAGPVEAVAVLVAAVAADLGRARIRRGVACPGSPCRTAARRRRRRWRSRASRGSRARRARCRRA